MKLYTKTGDQGTSSLYNGTRKCKNDIIFSILGDLDELNCNLGMAKAFYNEEMNNQEIKLYSAPGAGAMFYKDLRGIDSGKYYEWFVLKETLHDIQCKIMDISSFIATPPYDSEQKIYDLMETHLQKWSSKVGFDESHYKLLEKEIDRLQDIVPPIKNFVVPSGNKLISQIHIVRAITRRCERNIVNMYETEYSSYIGVYPIINNQVSNVKIYLNRLSDYFFALSRFIGMTLNIEEDLYSRRNLKI
jgi:cob(I)alamin adenosyltransferase